MSSAFFYSASHTSRMLPPNPYKLLAFGCMLSCLMASIFCEIWELHICVRSLLMKLFSRGLPRHKILYFDTFRLFHSFRQGFCILLTLRSGLFFVGSAHPQLMPPTKCIGSRCFESACKYPGPNFRFELNIGGQTLIFKLPTPKVVFRYYLFYLGAHLLYWGQMDVRGLRPVLPTCAPVAVYI